MNESMQFFKGFLNGIRNFSSNISTIVNTVLLAIVYFTAVGIVSLIAKLAGKSFLGIKKPKPEGYWSELDLKKKPINEYYRQF